MAKYKLTSHTDERIPPTQKHVAHNIRGTKHSFDYKSQAERVTEMHCT